MKLAEALQERADLNTRIEQLRDRAQNNALVQEGEKPAEDPKALVKELDECLDRLEKLIAAINLTNSVTKAGGTTLTELIARRDVLKLKLSAYRDIIYVAGRSVTRARGTEIKIVPVLKAAELQKKADELAREIRLTDNLIQQTNWTVDLVE